jgi:hypothetical protein
MASILLGAAPSAAAPLLALSEDQVLLRIDDTTRSVSPALAPRIGDGLVGGFAISPDGTQLAFVRWPQGPGKDPRLVLMPLAGGQQRTLARGDLHGDVSWAPDGASILFSRGRHVDDTLHVDTWSIARSGGAPTRLLADAQGARISADGRRLAYVVSTRRPRETRFDVVVRDTLTGESRVIGDGTEPAWSPDGTRVAYVSTRDEHGRDCSGGEHCFEAPEVYVADAATGAERRITETLAPEQSPSWSPDGTRIAVSSQRETRGAGREIWTFSPTGSCPVQVTWMGPGASAPSYEPAGSDSSPPLPCGSRPDAYTVPDVTAAAPGMLWPGARVGNRLVASVLDGYLDYRECAAAAARDCGPPFWLQRFSICERYPNRYGSPGRPLPPSRVWRRRGAIVAVWPWSGPGAFDVYTGSTTLSVFGVPPGRARAFVDRLRPVNAEQAQGPLPAPRFARKDLRVIRRAPQLREIARRLPARTAQPDCGR